MSGAPDESELLHALVTLTFGRRARQLKGSGMGTEVTQTERGTDTTAPDSGVGQGEGVPDRGLLLIGMFKLLKAVFFCCVGFGAIHMIQKNLGSELLRLVVAFRRDPEGRLVQLMLEKADLVDAHRLRQIGVGSFAYSALALTEGVGLMLQKVWAEYLTLVLTVSFLPWELFELATRPSWVRFGVLLTNLAVLGYLIWLLQRKKQRQSSV